MYTNNKVNMVPTSNLFKFLLSFHLNESASGSWAILKSFK